MLLQMNPQVLLSWLPELAAHLDTLSSEPASTTARTHEHLSHLVTWLRTEYRAALESLASLLAHAEITFDLIWALYVPGKTTLHIPCPTTGEPRAVRLIHAEKCQKAEFGGGSAAFDISGLSVGFDSANSDNSKFLYRLVVEYVETDIGPKGVRYGYAGLGTVVDIPGFTGTKKISTLGVYPLQYYEGPGGPDGLKARLVERGKRWASLAGGVHHLSYKGIAYLWRRAGNDWVLTKHSVSPA